MTQTFDSLKAYQEWAGQRDEFVLMLGATWCGPCKRFRPVFDKVSEQFDDLPFAFLYLDGVSDATEAEAIGAFDVMSVPTTRYVRSGVVTDLKEQSPIKFLKEVTETRNG